MLSLKDARDFVLLSYDMKLIKDDEFGLLFDTRQTWIYCTIPFHRLTCVSWTKTNTRRNFFQFRRTEYCLLFFSMSAFFDKAEVI